MIALSVFNFWFFFQAEDGIRDAHESRGLGDVYKRQGYRNRFRNYIFLRCRYGRRAAGGHPQPRGRAHNTCLLYTSDAADDLLCVDLGGRRIIKKKKRAQD